MHLNDGELRAYLDGEGSLDSRLQVEKHLSRCSECRQRQQAAAAAANVTARKLTVLAPAEKSNAIPVNQAQKRFHTLITEKDKFAMKNRWTVRYRPALIAAGLILVLAVSMAFAPVRAIANSFLGLFRVQQLQVVQVDPGNLAEQLGNSYQLQYFMSNDVQLEQLGENQEVGSAVEASILAGIPVRLPPGMNGEEHLIVTTSAQVNFTVDLELMQAVLAEIGRDDISLPQEIDGAEVTIELPEMVNASYGDCFVSGAEDYPEGYDPDDPINTTAPNCTTLVQMRSPQVNAPVGLDLNKLGQAYLQLLGMAPDEAAQFSGNIDWATTLVVPIPLYYETTYQEVGVDGVRGTLILGNDEGFGQQYTLIWIKGGMVYVLTGPGGADTAVRLGNSIR